MPTCATSPFTEEGRDLAPGAIDELIDQHERPRWQILPQRPDRAQRDDVGDTDPLEGIEVRAVVDQVRGDDMPAPVTREERQRLAVELT
jgi:hypothetical protein